MIERFFVGTAQAMAGGPAPQAGQRGASGGPQQMWSTLFVLGSFILIFYFLLIRPQQKRQKEAQKMLAALKRGDKVLLSSGFYATIWDIKEDRFIVKLSEEIKVEVSKAAVQQVVPN
jgi:preprotein translocase subunit YajC